MTVLATDNFNRASIGANWTALTSWTALSIVSSIEVQGTADPCGGFYNALSPSSADYYAKLTAKTLTSGVTEGIGPMVRASNSAQTAYFMTADSSDHELNKVVAGTFTQIGSSGAAIASGDVVYLEAIGSAIQVKVNGANTIGVSDSAITAAGFGGIAAQDGGTNPTGDDWELGDFASASVNFARPVRRYPNKGPLRKSYGARLLGFRQGIGQSGPIQYLQSLNGAIAQVGALVKLTSTAKAGAVAMAGALVIRTLKVLSGAIASSSTLSGVKVALKSLAGAIAMAGTLVKLTATNKAGAIAMAGSLVKQIGKVLAGAISSAGSLVKQTRHAFSAAIAMAGTLSAVKVALKSLSGAIASAGTLARLPLKSLAGNIAMAATLRGKGLKVLSGSIAMAGVAGKRIPKVLAGVIGLAGSLVVAIPRFIRLKATTIELYLKAVVSRLTWNVSVTRIEWYADTEDDTDADQ